MSDLGKALSNAKAATDSNPTNDGLQETLSFAKAASGPSVKSGSFTSPIGDYDEGLNPNVQQYRNRAYNQPWTNELGRATGRTLLNVVPSIIGDTAAILDFEDYYNQDKEVGNAVSRWAEDLRKDVNEALPIYRKNPGEAFDVGDSAWWIENGSNIAESALSFAATGYGVGAGIKGVLKGAKWLRSLGQASQLGKGEQALATVLNATGLNQSESIRSAITLYDDTYKKALTTNNPDTGIPYTEDEAKVLASDIASYAVNVNRANVLLNLTSAAALMRGIKGTRNILKNPRLFSKQGAKTVFSEGAQEYGEETINFLAEKEAAALREATFAGKEFENAGLLAPIKKFSDFVGLAATAEGIESGVLGAVGGISQTSITHGIQSLKGKNQRAIERYDAQQAYIESLDAAMEAEGRPGMFRVLNKTQRLGELVRKKEALAAEPTLENESKIREIDNQILAEQAFEAFELGTTDVLEDTYQKMPEEEGDMKSKQDIISNIRKMENLYERSEKFINKKDVFDKKVEAFNLRDEASRIKGEMQSINKEFQEDVLALGIDLAQHNINLDDLDFIKRADSVVQSGNIETEMDRFLINNSNVQDYKSALIRLNDVRERLKSNFLEQAEMTSRPYQQQLQQSKVQEDLDKFNKLLDTAETEKEIDELGRLADTEEKQKLLEKKKVQKKVEAKKAKEKVEIENQKQQEQAKEKIKQSAKGKPISEEKASNKGGIPDGAISAEDLAAANSMFEEGEPLTPPPSKKDVIVDPVEEGTPKQDPEEVYEGAYKVTAPDAERASNSSKPTVEKIGYQGDTKEVKEYKEKVESKTIENNPNKATALAYKTHDANDKIVEFDERLLSDAISEGTELELRIVTENDEVPDAAKPYVGKGKSVDDAFIGVFFPGENKLIAGIHTPSWFNGDNSNNPEKAAKDNRLFRAKVLKNQPLRTKVTKKNFGALLKTKDKGQVSERFREHVFVITKDGKLFLGKEEYSEPTKNGKLATAQEGVPHIIGYGANGERIALPTDPVHPSKEDAFTIKEAIRLYMEQDTASEVDMQTAQAIERDLGINIYTLEGIEEFVKLFVYPSNLNRSDIDALTKDTSGDKRYITFSEGQIKFGLTGTKNHYLKFDKEGKPVGSRQNLVDVYRLLEAHLKQMYYHANADMLGNGESYVRPRISEDGKYSGESFNNYEGWLATVTTTNIAPMVNEKDVEIVTTNPVIELEPVSILLTGQGTTKEQSTPTTEPVNSQEKSPSSTGNQAQDVLEVTHPNGNTYVIDFNAKTVTNKKTGKVLKPSGIVNRVLNDSGRRAEFESTEPAQVKPEPEQINAAGLDMSELWQDMVPSEDVDGSSEDSLDDTIAPDEVEKELTSPLEPIKGFTAYQEKQAVNSLMVSFLTMQDKSKETSGKKIWNGVRALFQSKVDAAKAEGKSIPAFEKLLGSYGELTKKATQRLANLQIVELEGDFLEGFEDAESVLDVNTWNDGWSFKIDPKSTATRDVKKFLAFIPIRDKVEGTWKLRINQFGFPEFVDFDEVYNKLSGLLADTEPLFDNMMDIIKSNKEVASYMPSVMLGLQSYKGDVQRLRNQFVVSFAKSYEPFRTILWKKTGKDEQAAYDFKVIRSDRNDVVDDLISQWISNLKDSGAVKTVQTEDIDDFALRAEVIEEAKEEFQRLNTKAQRREEISIKEVSDWLSKFGVTISDTTLNSMKSDANIGWAKHFTNSYGIFRLMYKRLLGVSNEAGELSFNTFNPLVNNSGIKRLAGLEAKFVPSHYTNSLRNVEGNVVYAYSLPKLLKDKVRRLFGDDSVKKLELKGNKAVFPFQGGIVDDNGKRRYATWLERAAKGDTAFKESFMVSPFDGIKKEKSKRQGSQLSGSGLMDLMIIRMNMFFNQGASNGFYLHTIPGKTTSYMISYPKEKVSLKLNPKDKNGRYNLGEAVMNMLFYQVEAEYARIKQAEEKKHQIKGYNEGASLFYFFPELNSFMFEEDGSVKELTEEVRREIYDTIQQVITDDVKSTDINKIPFDKSNLNSIAGKAPKGVTAKEMALIEFEVNNRMARFNMHQALSGDPALFYKPADESIKGKSVSEMTYEEKLQAISDTFDNVDKRLAKDIAPGMSMPLENENEEFISIAAKDLKSESRLSKDYYARLQAVNPDMDLDKYNDIEIADAQEYTTLKEHLLIMYRFGKIPTDRYNQLIERIDREGDNLVLFQQDLDIILQPIKPVYTDEMLDYQEGVVSEEYVKSSSFPLIPQLTKGMKIDALRRQMEQLEAEEGVPVRLAFDSGRKLGIRNSVSVFNENEEIISDIQTLRDGSRRLKRRGFRIQQEVPYSADKSKSVDGSQQRKLIFANVMDLAFDNMSGETLKREYLDLYEELFDLSLSEVYKEIKNDNGTVDIESLGDFIKKEAVRRGWSPVEAQAIEVMEGKFRLAPWAMPTSKRMESLLTSVFNNRVVKRKRPGRSYVLASEAGFNFSNMEEAMNSGIVFTKKFYEQGGELMPSETLEDGTVTPDQVMIPSFYRNSKGELVNIKRYVDKDGFVDSSKLPDELREAFGFRIPTASHGFMAKIEVVGFLPPSMGDLMIAPRDFIVRMGSDFDIDKFYMFHPATVSGKEQQDNNGIVFNPIRKLTREAAKTVKPRIAASKKTIKDSRKNINKLNRLVRKENNSNSPDLTAVSAYNDEVFRLEELILVEEKKLEIYSQADEHAAIFNELLDINMRVMSHPDVHRMAVQPEGTGVLKEISKLVSRKRPKKYSSPASTKFMDTKYSESIAAGNLGIGIKSNDSTFNAIIQGLGKKLRFSILTKISKDEYREDGTVRFIDTNGELIEANYLNDITIAADEGEKKGKPISGEIALYQSAALDNEKDPIFGKINSNNFTFAVERALIQLGFPASYVARFTSQPVMWDYAETMQERFGFFEDFTPNLSNTVVTELMDKYTKEFMESYPKQYSQFMDGISKLNLPSDVPINFNDLKKSLEEMGTESQSNSNMPTTKVKSPEFYRAQLSVLYNFDKLNLLGKQIQALQSLFNADSQGVGKDMFELQDKEAKLFNLREGKLAPNILGSLQLLAGGSINGIALEKGAQEAYKTWLKDMPITMFPYDHLAVEQAFDEYELVTGKELDGESKGKLFGALKDYLFASFNSMQSERERLFFNTKERKALAKRVKELKDTEMGRKNAFLQRVHINVGNPNMPSFIEYRSNKAENLDEGAIFSSIMELFRNPDTKSIAKDILIYSYLSGASQGARNFIKYFPLELWEATGMSEYLNGIDFHNTDTIGWDANKQLSDFVLQYFQHNPLQATTANKLFNTLKGRKITGLEPQILGPSKDDKDLSKNNYIRMVKGVPVYTPLVSVMVDNKLGLYQFKGVVNNRPLYERINTLGATNFIEYGKQDTEGVKKSLISYNNIKEQKQKPANTKPKLQVTSSLPKDEMTAEDALDLVINSQKVGPLIKVARLLKTIPAIANKRVVEWNVRKVKGSVSNTDYNTARINSKQNATPQELQVTILHELVHTVVNEAVHQFENGDYTGLSKDQLKSLRRLEATQKNFKKMVLEDKIPGMSKAEYIQAEALFNAESREQFVLDNNLTVDEGKRLIRKYYAILPDKKGSSKMKTTEFLTMAFTDVDFQRIINNTNVNNTKENFAQRLASIVMDLINSMVVINGKEKQAVQNDLRNVIMDGMTIATGNNSIPLTGMKESKRKPTPRLEQGDTGLEFKEEPTDIPQGANISRFLKPSNPISKSSDTGNPYGITAEDLKATNNTEDYLDDTIDVDTRDYSRIKLSLNNQIKRLNERKARTTDETDKASIDKRIRKIENQLEELEKEISVDAIYQVGEEELDNVETMLNKDSVSDEELEHALRTTSMWINAPEAIFPSDEILEGSAAYEKITQLRARASNLKDRWHRKALRRMVDILEDKGIIDTRGESFSEKDLMAFQDISSLTSNYMDISRTGNPILSAVDDYIRQASNATNEEMTELLRNIDELDTKLKKSSFFKKNGYKGFAQRDKDGNLTGNLIGEISADYYEEKNDLLNKAKRAKNNSGWVNYFKWVKENHTVPELDKLFSNENGYYKWNPSDDYLNKLKLELGENYKDFIATLRNNINSYNEQRMAANNVLQAEDMQIWEIENDPGIWLEGVLDPVNGFKKRVVSGKLIKSKGHQFVNMQPKAKWNDTRYNEILANEDVHNYYKFITSQLEELYSYLPDDKKEYLNKRYIPNFARDIAEKFNEGGMQQGISGLGDWFKDLITDNVPGETDYRVIDESTGKSDYSLPVYGLPSSDELEREVDNKTKSYNLTKVVKLFGASAMAYKHKARVEDPIRLGRSLLNEAQEQLVNPEGKPLSDTDANARQDQTGLTHLKSMMDYSFRAFFGDRRDVEGATSKKFKVEKDREMEALLDAKIENIKNSTLPDEKKEKLIKSLEKRKEKLGSNFTLGKAADAAIQYTQLKGMGWNIFAGFNNMTFGTASNFIHAMGGEDFTLKQASRALGIMTQTLPGVNYVAKDAKKIRNLMEEFNVLKEITDAMQKNMKSAGKKSELSKLSPYEIQRSTEYLVQGQNMVALMLGTQVTDLEGNVRSLWEAYDSDGNWNTKEFGSSEEWTGKLYSGEGASKNDFINKITQLNKLIHGNYDSVDSPVKMKSKVFGRALLQFRSWIAEGVANRLEDEKYDPLLHRNRKGRWKTYKDVVKVDGFPKLMRRMIAAHATGGNADLSNVDRANLRKNLMELYIIAVVNAAAMGIAALMAGDDDKEYKMVLNFWLNVMNRLSTDFNFYSSPLAFDSITRSALPVTQNIIDLYNWSDAVTKAILGQDELKSGVNAGRSRLGIKTAKLFPGTIAFERFSNTTKQVFDKTSISKNVVDNIMKDE